MLIIIITILCNISGDVDTKQSKAEQSEINKTHL